MGNKLIRPPTLLYTERFKEETNLEPIKAKLRAVLSPLSHNDPDKTEHKTNTDDPTLKINKQSIRSEFDKHFRSNETKLFFLRTALPQTKKSSEKETVLLPVLLPPVKDQSVRYFVLFYYYNLKFTALTALRVLSKKKISRLESLQQPKLRV